MKMKLTFAVCVFLVLALPSHSALDKQAASAPDNTSKTHTGKLQGRITDTSGRALKHATVILKDNVTNDEIRATTNKKGTYQFSSLFPGTYTVRAEAKGHKPSSEEARIQNGSVATVNLQLNNE